MYDLLRSSRRRLTKHAARLHAQCCMPEGGTVSITDLQRFENCLSIGITVVSSLHNNSVIYSGDGCGRQSVCLYMVQEDDGSPAHYHTITNIKGFLGYNYYGRDCHVGFACKGVTLAKPGAVPASDPDATIPRSCRPHVLAVIRSADLQSALPAIAYPMARR